MVRTISRPPAGGEDQHKLDFLHGVDLDRVHVRPERVWTSWAIAGSIILFFLVAFGVVLLLSPTLVTVEYSAHDSGIAQAIQAREVELATRIEQAHDSGIALAVAARNAELGAMHDSGIAQALAAHEAAYVPFSAHDSGIARAVAARNAELNAMHDSGIAKALRER